MDSHLIYQLIAGAVILGFAVLFLRLIGILLTVAIMGVAIYYFTMATEIEKNNLKNCAIDAPMGILNLKIPSSCNLVLNNIKGNIPNKMEEKAKEEGEKIEGELKK